MSNNQNEMGMVETRVEFYEGLKNNANVVTIIKSCSNENESEINNEIREKINENKNDNNNTNTNTKICDDKSSALSIENKFTPNIIQNENNIKQQELKNPEIIVNIENHIDIPEIEKKSELTHYQQIVAKKNNNDIIKFEQEQMEKQKQEIRKINQKLEYDFENLHMWLIISSSINSDQIINKIKLDSPFLGISIDDKKQNQKNKNNKNKNVVMTLKEFKRRFFSGEKIYLNGDDSTIKIIKQNDQSESIFALYTINEISLWVPIREFLECLVYSEVFCRPDLPISYASYSNYDIEKYRENPMLFP
jgi:hypothetical protein